MVSCKNITYELLQRGAGCLVVARGGCPSLRGRGPTIDSWGEGSCERERPRRSGDDEDELN